MNSKSRADWGGRPLHENPDHFVKAELSNCAACGELIPTRLQQLLQRYDKVELPPIKPVVTRAGRYGCVCSSCGSSQIAAVPTGLEPGSPLSRRIQALVTALRYGQGISYNRMAQMLGDIFELEISEGGIGNGLKSVKQ